MIKRKSRIAYPAVNKDQVPAGEVLLDIRDLNVNYQVDQRIVKAVNHLNLRLESGSSLGLVGETGAGKTTTALSILRLIPQPPGHIASGEIIYAGQDLLKQSKEYMRHIRGGKISMIFQDPMTSLNPSMTIGEQIDEVLGIHEDLKGVELRERTAHMLELVGIDRDRLNDYPHQFSGGMQQRVVIAMALACNPQLLIADEPTTALDVTIQAQVLNLMRNLREEFNTSLLLITHDLGVVAKNCDKLAVMYAGSVIEYGSVQAIYSCPKHPYTIGLFNSIPKLEDEKPRLEVIQGLPPDPADLPQGCAFWPRCPHAMEICKKQFPSTLDLAPDHQVACHLFTEKEAE